VKTKIRLLLAIGVLLSVTAVYPPALPGDPVTVKVFHSLDCPYCVLALEFLRELESVCPEVEIQTHDVYLEREYWQQYTREHGLPEGVYPLMVVAGEGFVGFLRGEGPLERHPTGKAYLGYSTQIARAIQEEGVTCDLTAFVDPPEDTSPPETADSAGNRRVGGPNSEAQSPGRSFWLLLAIPLYAASYLPLGKTLREERRRTWWIGGLMVVSLGVFGYTVWSLPEAAIRGFADSLPFPGFVAIVAFADGFNPCAFTVLVILLSLLTHLRRREAMMVLAGTFVATSAVMYGVFILAFAVVGGWFLATFGSVVLRLLGALVVAAGTINLAEGLGLPVPASLSLSPDRKTALSRRAGRIVTRVQKSGGKALWGGIAGTVFLASAANLAELGCTAVLPLVFIARLFGRFGPEIGAPHIWWTAVYAGIYVVPLGAVAGGSVLLLRRGRLGASTGRALKIAGGVFMLAFGLGMLLRPEWLGI
jgi:glutaredoxin